MAGHLQVRLPYMKAEMVAMSGKSCHTLNAGLVAKVEEGRRSPENGDSPIRGFLIRTRDAAIVVLLCSRAVVFSVVEPATAVDVIVVEE